MRPNLPQKTYQVVLAALTASIIMLLPGESAAQSIASGDLSVSVTGSDGSPLPDAVVAVTRIANGRRAILPNRGGPVFLGTLLAGGEYSVTVEHIGFAPAAAVSVLITPGHTTQLAILLNPAVPPVVNVDTLSAGSGTGAAPVIRETRTPMLEARTLPGDSATITDFRRLSVGGPFTNGRPGTSAVDELWIDGLAAVSAQHPRLERGSPVGSTLPRSFVGEASEIEHPFDAEWSASGGALLGVVPFEGGGRFRAHGFLDWSAGSLVSSGKADLNGSGNQSFRGAGVVSGPIVRDTSSFTLGLEARRIERPSAASWRAPFASLVTSAQQTLGVDLSRYAIGGTNETELVGGFGRLDWNFSSRSRVLVNLAYSSLKSNDFAPSSRGPARLDTSVDATDVNGQIQYQSGLGRVSFQEFRVGFNRSERTFGADGPLPTTRIVDEGLDAGSGMLSDGNFIRSDFQLREVFHFPLGSHRLKFGLEAFVTAYEQRYLFGGPGEFTFGDEAGLLATQGTFFQVVGPAGSTTFTTTRIGGFLQDTWMLKPGLDFRLGLRIDGDIRPIDDVRINTDWALLTNLANTDLKKADAMFSPRFGLEWDVGNTGDWTFVAEVSRDHARANATIWGELLTIDGRTRVRRSLGVVPWPSVPDSTVAPVVGQMLTLASNPDAPTSLSSVIGISRNLGNTSLSVSGSYRHTDFLTRRADLNRLPTAVARDQYGRPVYGDLAASGGLLTATVGTNRRFPGFDLVSSLNQDGFLDYWEVSLKLEHHTARGTSFAARYSYSRTDDNLPQRGFASPFDELSPFPDSLSGVDWFDGKSDLDIPHRAVIFLQTPVPGWSSLVLSAVYRFQSGLPFTPGFRDGVDANGDGSAGNDPAFIDEALVPAATLSEFSCLRRNVGGFAARNSCRAPGVHRLDLGLAIRLPEALGGLSLYAEVLNVTDSDPFGVDRALYLVDPTGTLVQTGSSVNVPLVPNPNFGKTLFSRASGRTLRFGVRL